MGICCHPYFITAGLLALLICYARSLSQIKVISVCAPVLMSACELAIAFFVAIDPPELRSFHRILLRKASCEHYR